MCLVRLKKHSQSHTIFLLHCYNPLVSYCLLSSLHLFCWASFACLFQLVSNILGLKSNNYILSFLVFLSSFSVNLWGILICQFFSSLGPFRDMLTRSSSDGVLEKISNKASNEKNDIFHGTKFGFGETFY